MSEHDAEAVVDMDEIMEPLRAYIGARRRLPVANMEWERWQRDYRDMLSRTGQQLREDATLLHAALSALRPGRPLPGGGVWMPVEMTDAIAEAICTALGADLQQSRLEQVYRAMIAAAAEPTTRGPAV